MYVIAEYLPIASIWQTEILSHTNIRVLAFLLEVVCSSQAIYAIIADHLG